MLNPYEIEPLAKQIVLKRKKTFSIQEALLHLHYAPRIAKEVKQKKNYYKKFGRPKKLNEVQQFLKDHSPQNIRQMVLCYFLSGGKVHPDTLVEWTGFKKGSVEFRSLIWLISKQEPKGLDRLARSLLHIHKIKADETEVENEIQDILRSCCTKRAMLDSLKESVGLSNNEELKNEDDLMMDYYNNPDNAKTFIK